jgi:hypothetical protein
MPINNWRIPVVTENKFNDHNNLRANNKTINATGQTHVWRSSSSDSLESNVYGEIQNYFKICSNSLVLQLANERDVRDYRHGTVKYTRNVSIPILHITD